MNLKVVLAITRQEIRQSLRNKSFLGLVFLLLVFFTVSAVVSTRAHEKSETEMQLLQDVVAKQWREQPDRHPHRVAHYGYLAFRTRPSLSFFDLGVSDYAGNSVFLEAHVQNSANFSEARQDSSLLRFGAFTPAFVLQLLMPLLVIFLLGESVGRERDSGTLAQVLSLGVRWRELLIGKALGGFSVFFLLLLPASAALIVVAAQVSGKGSSELLSRLCLLAIFYAIYLLIWVLLSVLVSAKTVGTGRATVVLLGFWILCTTFLPKALPSLGAYLHPAPSRPEFENRLHVEAVKGGHGHDPKAAEFANKKKELLDKYGVDSVEELPLNWRGVAMREGEKASTETYKKHYESLQSTYQDQNQVSAWGSAFSPFLAIKKLSSGLCGTDFRSVVLFEREAEGYRYRLIQQLNDLHIHHVKYEGDKSQRVSAEHWGDFEPFGYDSPALSEDLRELRASLLMLLLQWFALTVLLLNSKGRVR